MGKVKCLKCLEVLESLSVHDFKKCNYDNETFVDGGDEYMRYGGVERKYIKILDVEDDE